MDLISCLVVEFSEYGYHTEYWILLVFSVSDATNERRERVCVLITILIGSLSNFYSAITTLANAEYILLHGHLSLLPIIPANHEISKMPVL